MESSRRRSLANRVPRLSPRGFLRLAIVSLIGLIVILPSGGLVRVTGSGLGCPDWPGCHGELVPALSGHAAIEYSNRLLSALIVGISIVTWLFARRVDGAPRSMSRWALLAGGASAGQAPLGGLTVIFDLHPLLVAAHFMLSLVALAGAVVTVVLARDHVLGRPERSLDRRRAQPAGVMLAALAAVVVTGMLTTSAGPHPGDPQVQQRFWELDSAAALHVRVVIAFVVIGVLFVLWLRRNGAGDPAIRPLATVFGPLLALQIAVGEYQYRNQLPWQVIVVHIAIAGSLVALGIAIAWLVGHPLGQEAQTAQSERSVPASGARPASTASRQARSTESV